MEYKAKKVGNEVIIVPNIEKKENGDVIVHVPNMATIAKFTKENGKRNIQQV